MSILSTNEWGNIPLIQNSLAYWSSTVPCFTISSRENIRMVKDVVAQISGPGQVVEDLGEVSHVVVDGPDGSDGVDPVVVLAALAEPAHLLVLLVVLKS